MTLFSKVIPLTGKNEQEPKDRGESKPQGHRLPPREAQRPQVKATETPEGHCKGNSLQWGGRQMKNLSVQKASKARGWAKDWLPSSLSPSCSTENTIRAFKMRLPLRPTLPPFSEKPKRQFGKAPLALIFLSVTITTSAKSNSQQIHRVALVWKASIHSLWLCPV